MPSCHHRGRRHISPQVPAHSCDLDIGSGSGHWVGPSILIPDSTRSTGTDRQSCQNIAIRLTSLDNSAIEAASYFQEDLMANLWSSTQLLEHFLLLWTAC